MTDRFKQVRKSLDDAQNSINDALSLLDLLDDGTPVRSVGGQSVAGQTPSIDSDLDEIQQMLDVALGTDERALASRKGVEIHAKIDRLNRDFNKHPDQWTQEQKDNLLALTRSLMSGIFGIETETEPNDPV